MKKKTQTIAISIIFIIGLSLFLYPIIGNVLNTLKNDYEIAQYRKTIQVEEPSVYDEMFEHAREINQYLTGIPRVYEEDDPFLEEYRNALSVTGGMMGFLMIDKINVNLSILFGTSEAVLQNAVGLLEGTHLPTGDIGNGTVLSGHTGLPSAELLTNLDQMEIGDTFEVVVLNQTFTYEVFEINVVLPYEVDTVAPREDIDMVTLLTCTPYGVNSHRLLVHGKQIETEEEATVVPAFVEENIQWMEYLPVLVLPIIVILVISIVRTRKRARKTRDRNQGD